MDNTLKQIQKILDQACDKQRKASNMPEIPVVSALDIEDKDALNDKLDACDTNETVVQDTDEYLLVLVATDRLFEFMKAFPV